MTNHTDSNRPTWDEVNKARNLALGKAAETRRRNREALDAALADMAHRSASVSARFYPFMLRYGRLTFDHDNATPEEWRDECHRRSARLYFARG